MGANATPPPGRSAAALEAWFTRQAAREARAVYLEEALLTGEFGRYARYRLQYFFARYLAESVLHAVKFVLLYSIFSASVFVHLVLVNTVAGLLASFWWGALEVLRARVRQRFRSAKPHLAPAEISRWLVLAALTATLVFVLPVGWIAWDVGHAGADLDIIHFYVLAIGLRLALDLLTMTFHAGVYAVRRVYRPLSAIVGLELVGFLITMTLWPWLGPWCFPIALLAGTLASTAVLVRYTARLYRFFGFLPLPAPARLGWPRSGAIREFFAAGVSHALMRLDAFLVLALFHTGARAGDTVPLFVALFAIGPTVRAGFDWAHLFYFDLKRLEVRTFANLKRRYDRFLSRLSVTLGVVFWGLACLFGALVIQRPLGALYWWLGPLFVSRSALALVQIRAFSERRYMALLGSGLLLLGGIGALRVWVAEGGERLALLIVLMSLAVALLGARRRAVASRPESETIRSLPEWLAELRGIREAVVVRTAQLWTPPGPRRRWAAMDRAARWRQRQIAERIARRLGARGAVTTVRGDRVAWYERAVDGASRDEAWLVRIGAGFVRRLDSSGVTRDGPTALDVAWRRQLLGGGLGRRGGRAAEAPEDLRQSFLALAPDGIVYAAAEPIPAPIRALSAREKRQILVDAAFFVRDLRVNQGPSRFEVTALAADGDLDRVFLLPRSVDARVRRRWAQRVRSANLAPRSPAI